MPQKITDDELLSRVEQELRAAQDYMGGKLSAQRRRALSYYMGQAEGDLAPPEVDGRSSFVSTDVADTVEWMLPSLLRIFTASDRVVSLTPRKPGAEQMAEDATDYLNYIFTAQNDGFLALHTMFKDALISKVGVLKVWWDDRLDEAREEYRGLSDQELAQLLDDEEVEPIEHDSRPDEQDAKQREKALQQLSQQLEQAQQAAQQPAPQQQDATQGGQQPQPSPAQQAVAQLQQQMAGIQSQPPVMVHDVTVKRTKKAGQVKIEPVPPEEFFVSRSAKRIADAPFVAHVVERTVSDLRAQGYDIADDELSSDESGMVGRSQERVQRWSYDDSTAPFPNFMEPPNDPSMRRVWVCEAYLRADVDGDGIAEWRRVLKVGRKLLENVECDGPPFVSVTPIPMPHRLFGLSVADLAMEVQKHKTAMIRAIQDNMYLQVNGRYFAVEGQVNLDDLLTSRPGGVVRVKQPAAVGALQQGMADMGDAYQLLEYMEVQKENRTGWSRQSAGGDANAINKTATGVSIVTNRADMRLELVARVFAETGVKDLFVQILKLVCQYQDQAAQFNLSGRWLEVNPREWRHQFDVTVNVGLGTNDPHIKMQQVGALMQMQQQLAQDGTGIVSPAEVYQSAAEMVKALGYKSADRFLKNPSQNPPPPPPPQPEQIKVQAQMQVEQAKLQAHAQIEQMKLQQQAQLDQVKREHEMQLEQARMHMQAQVDTNRQQVEADQKTMQMRQQAELDALKAQHEQERHLREMEFQRWKAQLDSETRILVAQIAAQTAMNRAQVAAAESFEDDEAGELGGAQE